MRNRPIPPSPEQSEAAPTACLQHPGRSLKILILFPLRFYIIHLAIIEHADLIVQDSKTPVFSSFAAQVKPQVFTWRVLFFLAASLDPFLRGVLICWQNAMTPFIPECPPVNARIPVRLNSGKSKDKTLTPRPCLPTIKPVFPPLRESSAGRINAG